MPDGPGGFRQDSSCPALLRVSTRSYLLRVQDYHLLRPAFPYRSTSDTSPYVDPSTPVLPKQNRFGLFPFRSPLLRKSLLFSLPPGTEMFQFPGFASGLHRITAEAVGLPHSDIHGSMVICTSPRLLAAYHVLLRLWEPRHPPYALSNFLLLNPCFLFLSY